MIFYFSGTGNSKWVASRIAKSLADKAYNICDEGCIRSEYRPGEGEKIGFVFPVHSWGPPRFMVDFIRRVNILNPKYIYFVCTCGDDTGYTGSIMNGEIRKRGWACNAGFSVIMPNTYVSFPGFDIDDEAIEKNKVMGASARIEHICQELNMNIVMKEFECYKGSLPFLKSYLIRPLFNKYALSAKPFFVHNDICIACGKCQGACPTGNVGLQDKKPVWGNECCQCLSCYHACPVHAIEYGRMTQTKGQYKGKYLV